ncbi:MAG: hypothetical protein WC521_07145 [Bdellovibrionales bacterium]
MTVVLGGGIQMQTVREILLQFWQIIKTKPITALAAFFLLYSFSFIWPTFYRYDHIKPKEGTSFPVRINRITGNAEMLLFEGWRKAEPFK